MEDLCVLIRTFRKYKEQYSTNDDEDWAHDSGDVVDKSELDFVKGLIDIMKAEIANGLGWSIRDAILIPGANALGLAPVSQAHHFIYGILDLIQQHVRTTDSGKVANEVMEAVLQIVQKSPSQSFLRIKAFEVLASLRTPGLANEKTIEVIETWPNSGAQEMAIEEWRIIKNRVEDMDRRRRKVKVPIAKHPLAAPTPGEVASP